MEDIKKLAKQCMSIVETSTYKDSEIEMWINAGINDLKRQGIKYDPADSLIQSTIVMYVKANFGNVDIKEKELSQKAYNLLCINLGLSSDYKVVE